MNTSQFMDKQIMDLSNSQSKSNGINDLMDLNNHPPQEDHEVGGGDKKDEILPNYDFQPIRSLASSRPSNFDSSNAGGARVWAAESKTNSDILNYRSLNSVEPAKVMEKDLAVVDATLILEIDKTMKKHADNLMHTLEGVSARLSQLESRSHHLENSVDGLRTFVGNDHANSDGKLRQIENMIREVQTGVLVVKDKQELLESQLHLSQLQISKVDQPEPQMARHMESFQHQAAPPPTAAFAAPLPPTLPNDPPPPVTPQNLAPPLHHPNQFPHRESYYPPPGQPAEPPPHHHQLPLPQPVAPLPHIRYSQPPSQQCYGNPSQIYEPPSSRTSSGFLSPYGPSPGLDQPYPYSGGSPIKAQQHSSSSMGPSARGGYPQLPNARVLPHALPTGSSSVSGSGNNRVPIDDVVDKVTNMGFPRDQVRATVRKLTENGQAVDLNVVLDKLMTDGVESQGPRAWFGR